jgi:hypothetical protein
MALSTEQIRSLLKAPINAPNLRRAVEHENRLKFHSKIITDTFLNIANGDKPESLRDLPYYQQYLIWVKQMLKAPDKYEQFKKLLVFPLKTNEVIDDISDEYVKIFDAEDSFHHTEFTEDTLEEDFCEYLDKIKFKEFWHNKAFNAMMTAINSIMIVDLKQEQETEKPEPYVHLLDIEYVIDYKFDVNGNFEYIIFADGGDRVVYLDSEVYRLYIKIDGDYIQGIENFHDLGYTPARSFWSDEIDKKNPINKQAPLSSNLGRLDWLLFFETAKESLDIYAAYPLYWAYESTCDYKDKDGNPCIDGQIVNKTGDNELLAPCPVCSSKLLVGPGSVLDVPIPDGEVQLNVPPAGIIGIDRASLDFNVNEAQRLRDVVVAGATGKNKLIQNSAINQDQVQGSFENQTNVLNWIARNFEKAQIWVTDTIGQLRYGDQYLGVSLSYGTSFYLQSVDDAIKEYSSSKSAGMPAYILACKMDKIEHIQSKNNSMESNRMNILKYLEPYPMLTLQELKNLGLDVNDSRGFVLKANFYTFVSQFELEYGSITEFGSALNMKTRIDKIKAILNAYADNLLITKNQVNG